jgi:hypothetical protein
MAYGTVKVDNITFDNGGSDQNVTVSGLYNSLTSGITVTGTISGTVVIGSTSVSGATVAGVTVTGTTVQGASGTFTSLTGTTTQGTTATYTTGSFTSLTGTTTTGTTSSFTSGVFTTLSGATATFTSGIIASGTDAAPSLAILDDPDTGVFSPGANQLAVATSGVEAMRIDSSARLLVGTSTARSDFGGGTFTPSFQFGGPGNDFGEHSMSITREAGGPAFTFANTGTGGNTIVGSGQSVGFITFEANDGDDLVRAALIAAEVDGTPGANDMPGCLVFSTNAGAPDTSPTERMRIDSRGNVFFNSSTPTSTIWADDNAVFHTGYIGSNGSFGMDIVGNGYRNTTGGWTSLNQNGSIGRSIVSLRPGATGGVIIFGADNLTTSTEPTERMRIDSGGNILIGQSTTTTPGIGNNTVGICLDDAGTGFFSRAAAVGLRVNRTADGALVAFASAGIEEGNISISGTTTSYNGAHLSRWSQLSNNAERIEILRGSVLSNIDEMCEWGEEDNEQLNRMKVSDVEGDKNVSGVFQDWDDDDETYTDDFYCAMTGDFIIRIAEGVTVERGDLLMSAGDGTAKPQDDDIIRSKTIAKVTSTNVSCTHADGSYCVPCVLMAC